MNTLFFLMSKSFWLVCSPESLLVILIFFCFFLVFIKAHQKARRLSILLSVLIFVITVLPVGDWLLYPLENRFPGYPPPLTASLSWVVPRILQKVLPGTRSN